MEIKAPAHKYYTVESPELSIILKHLTRTRNKAKTPVGLSTQRNVPVLVGLSQNK